MTLAILSPLLAFVGLFIGAHFARNREMEKFRKDRITEAYARLLDAAAKNSGPRAEMLNRKRLMGQALNPEDIQFIDDSAAQFVNAHSNIVIYGSKEVITALSKFYDCGADPGNPASKDAYVELIKAMRHDSDAEDYELFGAQVDNILVSGPARRTVQMAQLAATQAQMAGSNVTFSQTKASN